MKTTMMKLMALCGVMSWMVACEGEGDQMFAFYSYLEGRPEAISTEQANVVMLKDFGLTFPVKMDVVVQLIECPTSWELPGQDRDRGECLDTRSLGDVQAMVLPGSTCTIEGKVCQGGECRLTLSAATSAPCGIDVRRGAQPSDQDLCFGWFPVDEASGQDNQPRRLDELQTQLLHACPHLSAP